LPQHMTASRMIRVALTAVSSTPELQECSALSVAAAIVQSSILGLEPNAVLGESYLIPFKGVCTLVIGYQGLIKLVRQSGELLTINAQAVRQNDRFEFEDGLTPILIHKRAPGSAKERGPVVCYWAGAMLKGGGQQFCVMYVAEVKDHMEKYSKSYKNAKSAWQTDFDQMALKTCIRKLCKFLPRSVMVNRAIAVDETGQYDADVPLELMPPPAPEQNSIEEPKRKSETPALIDEDGLMRIQLCASAAKFTADGLNSFIQEQGYESITKIPLSAVDSICDAIDRDGKA